MEDFHLIRVERAWRLQKEGPKKTTKVFSGTTKEEAVERAAAFLRSLDEPASLKIHKLDGSIEEERSYL